MVISVMCGRGTEQVEKAAEDVMVDAAGEGARIKFPSYFSDSGLRGGMRVY